MTPSTSSGSINGDVHCAKTIDVGCWPQDSIASIACRSADSLEAESDDKSLGRMMTSAPYADANRAIDSLSVETYTAETEEESWSACIVRTSSGMPPTCCRFLSGIPFEPPRAGIIATVLLVMI